MGELDKMITIRKDRKHQIKYTYGQTDDVAYEYICGPRTNNLWYKVIQDFGTEVTALMPYGVTPISMSQSNDGFKTLKKRR